MCDFRFVLKIYSSDHRLMIHVKGHWKMTQLSEAHGWNPQSEKSNVNDLN